MTTSRRGLFGLFAGLVLTPKAALFGSAATTVAAPAWVQQIPGLHTYQWFADGKPIDGATGSTYTLTEADIDREIGVRLAA